MKTTLSIRSFAFLLLFLRCLKCTAYVYDVEVKLFFSCTLEQKAMQIPITVLRKENGLEEWAVVELQGSLEMDGNPDDGSHIGDFSYTTDGVPILVIGHHALFGKEVSLEKPLAVMVKNQEGTNQSSSFTIRALVRHKIVFKSRPKPIVTQHMK